jgi:hypothetical protein
VNVTVPAERPVTKPEFVTDATRELLLAQVPPVEGDKLVVPLTQMLDPPVTTGNGYTVTYGVILLHPADEVKVKVAFPGDIPVTIPELVTVATEVLLLIQVPSASGDKVVVSPIQTEELPVISTTGDSLIVTVVTPEVAEHPDPLVTLTE